MGSITTAKAKKALQGEAIQTCRVSFNAYGLWPCVEKGRGRGGGGRWRIAKEVVIVRNMRMRFLAFSFT